MDELPPEISGELRTSILAGLLRVHSKYLEERGEIGCLREAYDTYAEILYREGWRLTEALLTELIPAWVFQWCVAKRWVAYPPVRQVRGVRTFQGSKSVLVPPQAIPEVELTERLGALKVTASFKANWLRSLQGRVAHWQAEAIAGSAASDQPHPAAAPTVSKEEAVFRKNTDIWTLSFNGKTIHLQHLVGLTYISELLRRPGTSIEAVVLAGRTMGADPFSQPGMPMADDETIACAHAELTEKRAALEGLRERDWPERGALKEEISQYETFLRNVEDHRGQARKVGGTAELARMSVTNAINRALRRISRQHTGLAEHLKKSIRTGVEVLYSPIAYPDWKF